MALAEKAHSARAPPLRRPRAAPNPHFRCEPEPQQDQEGADDISMNEIIRDVADSRITREEEETLSAEELAKKQAEKTVEVAAAMATEPITTARDMGTDLSSSSRGAPGGELRFERCFFLYGTLMFFVFRVRVKDPRRVEGRRSRRAGA